MIVGLTGRNAAGKGTVAAWFRARGFAYTSLSDAIRVWLAGQGKEPTRDHLIWGGRALRRAGGPGVLAERTLAALVPESDVIVDSIRTPAEVAVLRARPDFVLLEVHASEAVRWQRLAARGRAGDAATLEEFRRQEGAELSSADSAAQQLVATAALADIIVPNDGDEADLAVRLDALWRRLGTGRASG
ncbi:MAG: hypothetical protein EXR79_12325 [Myxococcales bacterium]|nr:hypothetical protein [Myxococcales bacterium]